MEVLQSNGLQETVKKALHNPDWFCDELLLMPNDEWQSELMNAIADLDRARFGLPTIHNHDLLNRFSIRAAHGVGKTSVCAKIMHWFQFTRRGIIPCTAPKLNQVSTRLFREFGLIGEHALKGYSRIYKKTAKKIEWFNRDDYVAIAESGQAPENIAGFHDKHLMFIVDEASGVHEDLYPACEGSLTTDGAIMVMIGNATRSSGEFWASHKKKGTEELYYKMKISYKDSPRVSRQWVESMIKKYGIKSPVVQTRVFAEFPEQSDNQLILLAWLYEARDKEIPYTNAPYKLRVCVDVADGGEDFSSITVSKIYEDFVLVIKQQNFTFPPTIAVLKTAEAAEKIFLAFGGKKESDDFVVDGLGVGAGTAASLIKKGYNVIVHKGGEAATISDYRNKRAQVYFTLRDALRDGLIFFDENFLNDEQEWDEFTAQLCSVQTKPGQEKVEELMTKKEMKEKGIKSPDRGDSTAMIYSPGNSLIEAW